MSFWQVVPFFPQFMNEKQIEPYWLGLFMSVLSMSFLFAALITGKYILLYIDRLTCCYLSSILLLINLIGLGSLYFLQDKMQIIYLTNFFQIIGGIGNALNNSSAMAIVSSYDENKLEYISYLETCLGLGGLLGPLGGSILHYFFGFLGPFYGLAIFYLLVIIILLKTSDRVPDDSYKKSSSKNR